MTLLAYKKADRTGSQIALAIALLCGSAVGITAFADTAYAQRKKDKKEEPEKAAYSKGFIAVYTPLQEMQNGATPDLAALKAGIPGLLAALETPDDRRAAGGMVYNIGIAASDLTIKRQGIDLMLASGKIPAADVPRYIVTAGQLASDAGDFTAAREHYLAGIAAGYVSEPPLEGVVAESFFKEDKYAEGLAYLKGVIDAKLAAGETPSEDWFKRGIAIAYNNDLGRDAIVFSTDYARIYPSKTSWGDAIAIQRTFFDYDANAMLDLLRLADRTKSLRTGRDYADYIEAADARRLPGEVKRILEEGMTLGLLERSDPFVAEAKTTVDQRIAADRNDLTALERDARAASATAVTTTAAGDAFLSYGMSEKAEAMYTSALTKSGSDTARVTTRLGIAQFDQGKAAEAAATFATVQGPRAPIAALWKVFAEQQGSAAPAVEPSTEAAM